MLAKGDWSKLFCASQSKHMAVLLALKAGTHRKEKPRSLDFGYEAACSLRKNLRRHNVEQMLGEEANGICSTTVGNDRPGGADEHCERMQRVR
jgi:hypothetical protein